jgi:hypothetical protein
MIFIRIPFAVKGRATVSTARPLGSVARCARPVGEATGRGGAAACEDPAMPAPPRRHVVPSALVVSGLAEIAAGALAGWPYTLVRQDPEAARRLGIKSGARIRQWHLDLAILGGLTVAVGSAVPDPPRWAAIPLGIGAWTNAMSFLPLAFKPDVDQHPAYRATAGASFIATSVGFTSMALVAAARRRRARRA